MLQVIILGLRYRAQKPNDGLVADGVFGPKTAVAVGQLQGRFKLNPYGGFGPELARALREKFQLDLARIPLEYPNEEVARTAVLQVLLFATGRAVLGLVIDGDHDPKTEVSLRLLQTSLGLRKSGVLDPVTVEVIAERCGVNFDAIPYDLLVAQEEPELALSDELATVGV